MYHSFPNYQFLLDSVLYLPLQFNGPDLQFQTTNDYVKLYDNLGV